MSNRFGACEAITSLHIRHVPGSFWHPRSKLKNIGAFGTRWRSDRYAAIDTGEMVLDDRGDDAVALRSFVLTRDREPYDPKVICDRVCIGPSVIDIAYFSLVMESYPAATWEAEGEHEPVVAMVGDRAVAVVMPLRRAG